MTEQDLIELGFERKDIDAEESGGSKGWHYYVYDFARGFSLITPASDEVVDNKWYVEVFENETIRFTNISDLMGLIDVINRNTL